MLMVLLLTIIALALPIAESAGILYPRLTETRDLISLDGIWNFALTDELNVFQGHTHNWYLKDFRVADDIDVQAIPVPSSYNDIGTLAEFRDHVGPVWYQRNFFVPNSWQDQRVWIRFSSVCRAAEVWVNGQLAVNHEIGHLPFHVEITTLVSFGVANNLTVAVDNRLLAASIPQGEVVQLDSGRLKQTYTFDFYNYAGIDRSVVLYTTPQTYIDDITVETSNDGTDGVVTYRINTEGTGTVTTRVTVLDNSGQAVDSTVGLNGSINIPSANLWWPYLMDPNPGYQYTLLVELLEDSGNVVDSYTQLFGIRTVTWDNKSIQVNGKPIYLRGFGRHEDSDIRGKGLDLALILKDHNLLKWSGANAYRTSHYPYSEEIMDLADEIGLIIIDESPAVNTEKFSDELLTNHKQSLTELYQRDKNRPSVIIWSAANEPRTQYPESENYYREVVAHLKSLDTSRPVTVVNNQLPDEEYSGQFLDVATINVYHGWYTFTGDLDVIFDKVANVTRRWNELHDIPVIMTEYGADTVEGIHLLPAAVWSEEYQSEFHTKYFETFDKLRDEGFFIGELIWNFADFKTAQTIRRVGGNRKGIFQRNRQPKAATYLVRQRYWALAQALDNSTVPDDLYKYTFTDATFKDEL